MGRLFLIIIIVFVLIDQVQADAHTQTVLLVTPKHKPFKSCPQDKTCVIFDNKYIQVEPEILKDLGYIEGQVLTPNQMIILNYRRFNGLLESEKEQ